MSRRIIARATCAALLARRTTTTFVHFSSRRDGVDFSLFTTNRRRFLLPVKPPRLCFSCDYDETRFYSTKRMLESLLEEALVATSSSTSENDDDETTTRRRRRSSSSFSSSESGGGGKEEDNQKSWIERGFAPSRVKAGKGALRFEGTAGRAGGEARTAGTAETAATSC